MEMARMEAHGPRTMQATPMPTAWPVVPPGSGRLNIMMTKENAANREISGMRRACKADFTRRRATYQNGAAAAARLAHVEGLREPSGMCIVNWAANRAYRAA